MVRKSVALQATAHEAHLFFQKNKRRRTMDNKNTNRIIMSAVFALIFIIVGSILAIWFNVMDETFLRIAYAAFWLIWAANFLWIVSVDGRLKRLALVPILFIEPIIGISITISLLMKDGASLIMTGIICVPVYLIILAPFLCEVIKERAARTSNEVTR